MCHCYHLALAGSCHPVVIPIYSNANPPARDHPEDRAPVVDPSHRLFHQNHALATSGFYIAPKRSCPLPQTICFPLGTLPMVSWKDPPKKPMLSAHNSRLFGPSRMVYLPPLRHRFSFPLLLPEQGVKGVKLKLSSHFLVQRR